MSQKSNILTIRFPNNSLDLDSIHAKQFAQAYKLVKVLKQSLEKKGILLAQSTIKIEKTSCFIKLKTFFGTQKLIKYKNSLQKITLEKTKSFFLKKLVQDTLNCKTILTNVIVLNHALNNDKLKKYFLEFKRFKNTLFSRQFSLFIDFVKLTSLFILQKISTLTYLEILGKIFKILPKNKHSRYFLFLEHLFKLIIKESKGFIKGMKLEISGKLKGKLRSSSQKISEGNISSQSVSKNLKYSQIHVYTVYGSFGIKL